MRQRIAGFARSNAKLLLVAGLVALVTGTTGAVAAQKFINSKKIKNGTIKLVDLNPEVRSAIDTSRSGTPGTPGAPGEDGADGADADFEAGNWGIMNRNTIGSPVADLRAGPFVPGANGSPPFGEGSLELAVADNATTASPPSEQATFGNEVDFGGDEVQGLQEVGFHVYTTGENIAAGGATPNMPSVKIEVDPNVAAVSSNFSTLVYTPSNSTANQWSGYIDAVDDPTKHWGMTGTAFNGTTCDDGGPRCTFAELQAYLNDGGDPALIGTVAVGKGRDFRFAGAVDGLRINNEVFDFEPLGVVVTSP